ncbi:MAG: ABC transporter permease [Desulfovibrio sp.]|uniref:ABC transporter permease n=1 Tax=Desulfovibrio sp. TaxID=885 RepID=UPI0039E42762
MKNYIRLRRSVLAIRMVWSVLMQHKLRTTLATLGVFMGAMLLTCILHVLESINLKLKNEAEGLGANLVTIAAAPVDFVRLTNKIEEILEPSETTSGVNQNSISQTAETTEQQSASLSPPKAATLTEADIAALVDGLPSIIQGVPFILASGQAGSGLRRSSCQMLGTTTAFPELRHFRPAYGRFFNNDEALEGARVCVLGNFLAKWLFSSPEAALGKTVRVGKSRLHVIGVMEEKGMDPSGLRMDELLILPIASYTRSTDRQEHISGAWLSLRDRNDLEPLKNSISTLLRERHRLPPGKSDFTLTMGDQVDELVGNALRLVRTLGIIGSGLSFAIGTLGILSIMTLLVRSRRLEIGLRRVAGATRRQILLQFMGEAAFMSAAGGFAGVCAALAFCLLLAASGALPPYFSLSISLGVFALSTCCGILAGTYPAWKAARTNVLQALRAD